MADLSHGAQESPEQKGHLQNEKIIKFNGVAWPSTIRELKAISSPRKFLDWLLPGASIPTNSHNLPLRFMKTQQGELHRISRKSQLHLNSKVDFQGLATSDPTLILPDLWELFVSLCESWRLLCFPEFSQRRPWPTENELLCQSPRDAGKGGWMLKGRNTVLKK